MDLLQQKLQHTTGLRMNTRPIIWLILATALLAGQSSPAAELYVSPVGSDTNSGTRAKPFATLERARDEARRLRQDGQAP